MRWHGVPMSDYRRFYVPGGTYFFTVNLAAPGSRLLTERISDLRVAYAKVTVDMPVVTRAIIVLPDHLHAIWTLPEGDTDFLTRWKRIKRDFTVRVGQTRARSASSAMSGPSARASSIW